MYSSHPCLRAGLHFRRGGGGHACTGQTGWGRRPGGEKPQGTVAACWLLDGHFLHIVLVFPEESVEKASLARGRSLNFLLTYFLGEF